MESVDKLKEAYTYLCQLQIANSTDIITIDYDRLDDNTKYEIKKALDDIMAKRKSKLYRSFEGVQSNY